MSTKKSKKKKHPQTSSKTKVDQKKKKSGYTFKQKLVPAVLLSLPLPLMVMVFGPFEIYAGNLEEFTYSLGDFFPLCILFAVIASALLFGLMTALNGIAFDIGCSVVAWISLMMFVQRNYLNSGIDALGGDGVGTTTVATGDVVVNTIVWLLVGAAIVCAVVFLRKKHIDTLAVVACIAMVALMGAQLISFCVTSMNTDVYTPVVERINTDSENSEPMVLTYKNVTKLSSGKNVVVFLLDRFDAKYYRKMQKDNPTYFDELDGFTYYDDYTSLYCRTYPAVASILTGKDHDYFNGTKAEAFERFYSDGGTLRTLYDKGYTINLYTEKGYAYTDASVMDEYVSNTSSVNEYSIDSKTDLSWDMIRLSLSEYLPHILKSSVGYLSTSDFNAHAIYDTAEDEYTVDENSTAKLYEYIKNNDFGTVTSQGQFTFIHLFGCHNTNQTSNENIEESFEVVYYYLDQMKALGVYDDATIIITGDHAAALSDSKMIGEASSSDNGTRVTTMLFKPSGSSGTELASSTAQISQDELWNTIFESEGLLSEKKGESFFDISEGEERVRRYIFEMYKNSKNNDLEYNQVIAYEITGSANDADNWEIVSRTDIIK